MIDKMEVIEPTVYELQKCVTAVTAAAGEDDTAT
jgi:hypothetical protein